MTASLPPTRFLNLGCRTNAAEVAETASLIGDARNAVVINSCTVTAAADRETRKAVLRARRESPGAAIVLMGCHVDAHPEQSLGADLLIPNALKPAPPPAVPLDPPGVRRSRHVLKVQDGCDNRCTFCIVWQTRGRSLSRVVSYLEDRARAAASAGYREIVLTGIDLGSFHGGLAALLDRLLPAAEPARIRLSSIDPSHIDRDLCELLRDPRLCPHLHLPLQSGADRILARMGRRYDLARFEAAVEMARSVAPELALTGDLMVGFPGETEADFLATLAAVERAAFMGLHVFRYSARPRTAAARHRDPVEVAIAQDRSRRLIGLGHRLRAGYEAKFEGRPLEVVWDRPEGTRIKGISANYIQVTAPAAGRHAGQLEEVRWQSASSVA